MTATALAARSELRRRPATLIGLTLIVALVTGVVLATVAGARRTSTVVDRFLEATASRDIGAFAITLGTGRMVDGPELIGRIDRRIEALPGVTDVGTSVGYPTGASDEFDLVVVASPDDSTYRTIDRPLLLEGRMPALTAPDDEVAINDAAGALLGVGLGDVIHAPTFSPDDCAGLANDVFLGFNGPSLALRVVGRVRVGDDLRGELATSGPIAIASPRFIDRHGVDVCATVAVAAARTVPGGPTVGEVQAIVDEEMTGLEKGLVATVEEDFAGTARSGVVSVTAVLVLVAAVAAAAGLVAVAQAIRRQSVAGASTSQALRSLGLSQRERALVVATPAIVSVTVGVAVGVGMAWLLSPAFPPSLARPLEPTPGRRIDGLVLLGGSCLLAAAGGAWSVVAARRAGASPQASPPPRPSRAVALAARLGWRPPSMVGLRLAFESGPAATRVPSRSAQTGIAAGVLGMVAVLVVASSTDAAIADPIRYGWSWSAMPDVEVDDSEALLATLASEPMVSAAARLVGGAVEVEGQRLQGHAVEDMVGTTALVIAEGRNPADDGEIALGGASLGALDVSIGDVVRVEGDDGVERQLTVVGRAVLPIVNDTTNPGSGAALTVTALNDLTRGGTEDNLVVTYAPGVDPRAAEQRLGDAGLTYSGYAKPQIPGRLLNLDEARATFAALAAFLALLGVVGLTHALAVSGSRRRVDFAVLRAMGFVRRQVRLSVGWQAVAVVAMGCAIGAPLGFVTGRLVWRTVVADLHMVEGVSSPLWAAAATVAAALLLGAVLAVVPGVLAAKHRPAELLRTE